ncbi:MAG: hypothetical protein JNM18_19560 [Planctomycetaceae bacterium]|nr:hypothetical protein [Planctomycetaceae bacterium]
MFKIPEPARVWSDVPSHHHYGHKWLTHFDRRRRHELVAADRRARLHVAIVLCGSMLFGLAMMLFVLGIGFWN